MRIGIECLLVAVALAACGASPDEAGALVPPTADQDPALPALDVNVAGRSRRLHLQTHGDPMNPPLFAFHGGGGNDFRALLPLRELASDYFVVLWDARGSGLSERITRDEISWDSYFEEILAVKSALSPNRPVHLLGYSWGGEHAARFAAVHPEAIASLILLEPGPLSQDAYDHFEGPNIGLGAAFVNEHLWQVDFLSPSDHAEIDRKAYAAARGAMAAFWCDPDHPGWYPMWRHGLFVDIVSSEFFESSGAFQFSEKLAELTQPVLVIGSSCGPLRADFQQKYTLPLFAAPEFTRLEGVSHMNLFIPELVTRVRGFLGVHAR